jgi:hypothetical protein
MKLLAIRLVMNRAAREAKSNSWSDDILELCSENSLNFTAFRAYVLLESHGRVMASSAPFIHRMWFLPLIIGYITGKRIIGLITRSAPQLSGHVFCCNSTAPYKTEAFFELAEYFCESGDETTLFGVSGVEDEFKQYTDMEEISTVTFGDCFFTVSPVAVLSAIPDLWNRSREMGKILEVESFIMNVIAFNFLITEFIKYQALTNADQKIETFHTYAAMPYQLKAVNHERIFLYQHGIEADEGNRGFSIPKYAPIRCVIWGETWHDEFERKAHSESAIYPIGSPRYDALADRRSERDVDIDVLFVSGSHVIENEAYDATAYRNLVEQVVELCNEHEWELAIKLHPIEDIDFYEQLGYDQYVVDENDISTLLLRSDIAVTDVSSSFIESLVLGTPMVVTQNSINMGFDSFGSAHGIAFPETLPEAVDTITRLKGHRISIEEVNASGFIRIGNSKEKIRSYCEKIADEDQ